MRDTTSVRSHLRDATRPAHARVDALFRHGFSGPAAYAGYLAGMHGFLGAAWHALPDLGNSLRMLRDDLQAVGLRAPPLPAPHPLAAGELLGWRYVIDGSTLGARVLLRQAAALGHDGQRGATFLAHHAAGSAWEATCRELEATPDEPTRRRELSDAAGSAFDAAYDAFRSALSFHRSTLSA